VRTAANVTILAGALLGLGCGSKASAPSSPNGTDDVKAACEVRAQWRNAAANPCVQCLLEAPNTPCTCDANQGVCFEQWLAKTNEGDCTIAIHDCTGACGSDCGCIDACFVSHARCRAAASALDGCVAQACDSLCR
jgi:hypothetical protein